MKRRQKFFRQIGAWVSIVVHLLAVSGMAQSALAVLAATEGSHAIGLQSNAEGRVLVLSHQDPATVSPDGCADGPGVRHASVVHSLLWIAHPQSVEQDHLIALTPSSTQFQRSLERLVDRPAETPVATPSQAQPPPHRAPFAAARPQPSSTPSLLLLAVNSTVLLI